MKYPPPSVENSRRMVAFHDWLGEQLESRYAGTHLYDSMMQQHRLSAERARVALNHAESAARLQPSR